MRRSRRIALTLVATVGVLGGGGVAVAVAGSTDEPTAPATPAAARAGTSPDTAARDALQAYVTSMAAHESRLEHRVAAAHERLERVRAERAARIAAARAAAATAVAAPGRATRQDADHEDHHHEDDHNEHDDD